MSLSKVDAKAAPPGNAFEALYLTPDGHLTFWGWVDDLFDPIVSVEIASEAWKASASVAGLARLRRIDVEQDLGRQLPHAYGYLGLAFCSAPVFDARPCRVSLIFRSGAMLSANATPLLVEAEHLRGYLSPAPRGRYVLWQSPNPRDRSA